MKKRGLFTITILVFAIISVTFFSFKVVGAMRKGRDIFLKTKILTDIIALIQDEYVDEVDPDMLLTKAINAMTDELDPHSQYVPPRNYERMSEEFLGYQGIGVSFTMIQDKITVMRVLRDGPSEKAGLKLGDRIIAIEGETAIGMKRDDVPLKLKGPKGTRVRVTIERMTEENPFDVIITRGQTYVESIKYYHMLDEETGYVNLEKFSRTSIMELNRAVRELEGKGLKRLVLDLRGNSGGLLQQAKEITDKFLPGGKTIVETKGRTRDSNRIFKSENSHTDLDIPLLVLINGGSASASEIVSGALQDLDRAIVIGKTSFGKGLMQRQIEFEDRSALLLTTGRWYTPLGRLIQKDYKNKSSSQYRMDAYNDSLNKAREEDSERPEFTTKSGRIVFGGGGIKPDIEIESTNLVSTFALKMAIDTPGQPIFCYSQEMAVNNKNKWKDVYALIENYDLEGEEMDRFLAYLKELKLDFKAEDVEQYKEDIEKYLEMNIAQFLWGDEGYYRAFQVDDNVLHESLTYFDLATALVKQ